MKLLITLLLSSFASITFGQFTQVKFKEETFANGMVYPQVVIVDSPDHADSINADINRRIADLEASDFCIGQYGYVQKSTHLQIHIFCSCIDFDESENRYFLYDIENGTAVPYSSLFDPKKTGKAAEYLLNKTKEKLNSKSLELTPELEKEIIEKNLDAFKVEMTKDGLHLWLENIEGWGKDPYKIVWEDLKPYLKYHFI